MCLPQSTIGAKEPDIEKTKEIVRLVIADGEMRPKEIPVLSQLSKTSGYTRTVRAIIKKVLEVQQRR
jgi:hypothetical protein